MSSGSHPIDIVHRPDIGRFEAHIDGLQGEVDYQLDGKIMRVTHTGVPSALEGRGIAGALVQAALTWARQQGYRVLPLCSYARAYIARHPEWQDLVA